jgi:hypothetical protein
MITSRVFLKFTEIRTSEIIHPEDFGNSRILRDHRNSANKHVCQLKHPPVKVLFLRVEAESGNSQDTFKLKKARKRS